MKVERPKLRTDQIAYKRIENSLYFAPGLESDAALRDRF